MVQDKKDFAEKRRKAGRARWGNLSAKAKKAQIAAMNKARLLKLAGMVLLLFLLASPVQALEVIADCRIDHLQMIQFRRPDGLHLKVRYFGHQGRRLTQRFCPDQNVPTWAFEDFDGTPVDVFGYEYLVSGEGEHEVYVATIQRQLGPDGRLSDRIFRLTRTVRLP